MFSPPRRQRYLGGLGLSFAALIFAPPLSTLLAYGIAATFITTAIGASIVAARSSVPFAIAGPDPTTVAVTATLVTALMARFAAEGAPDDLLAPVIIIMALAAALTGLLLCGSVWHARAAPFGSSPIPSSEDFSVRPAA